MSTGLGINKDSAGNGRSPLDERLVNGGLRTPGVISGCAVTTSSSAMRYAVAVGVAQVSRSATDGGVPLPVPATTSTVDAGPGSGSRIDVVWVRQHDPDQGDPDALVEVGVTQGAAAASPTKPTLPTGALQLKAYTVPAGATATSACTVYDDAPISVSWDGSRGVLAYAVNTFAGSLGDGGTMFSKSFRLDTPRTTLINLETAVAALDPSTSLWIEEKYELWIDGARFRTWMTGRLGQSIVTPTFSTVVSMTSGTHTVQIKNSRSVGATTYAQQYYGGPEGWAGAILLVTDLGVWNS